MQVTKHLFYRLIGSVLVLWLLMGCSQEQALPGKQITATTSPVMTSTRQPAKPANLQPSPTLLPTETNLPPTPEATSTPTFQVCSPLQGVPIQELAEHIVNPYNPPRLGSDDPHQGVDLAVLDPVYQIALSGTPVSAVINGKIVTVIQDRFPYGNAVLIETRLDHLPPDWIDVISLPTPAPTLPPHPSLNCPQTGDLPDLDTAQRAIYILYAHMQETANLQPGDQVECGDRLGTVGMSGNALNPHLHLEVRSGPAGARFPGIAHYETRATPVEMESYCLWRVSGLFQLINPMRLFDGAPEAACYNFLHETTRT